mmetsp:Transcript_30733/g.45490  ORF Transcript_30733/g.45490 Transcript_30733/m.45490 type:complete len:99 (+) Transcript_30733:110-406(+)
MSSSSLMSQLLAPGGGIVLIPFIRIVIGCLMLTCMCAFGMGIARIHMIALSILSAGLLGSLSFFESEYNKLKSRRGGNSTSTGSSSDGTAGKTQTKTD